MRNIKRNLLIGCSIIFSTMIFNCEKYVVKESPYYYQLKDDENPNLGIIKTVWENPYNKEGVVVQYDEINDYGQIKWLDKKKIIFSEEIVSEIKKYNSPYDVFSSNNPRTEEILDKLIAGQKQNNFIIEIK